LLQIFLQTMLVFSFCSTLSRSIWIQHLRHFIITKLFIQDQNLKYPFFIIMGLFLAYFPRSWNKYFFRTLDPKTSAFNFNIFRHLILPGIQYNCFGLFLKNLAIISPYYFAILQSIRRPRSNYFLSAYFKLSVLDAISRHDF
jgi:hypothetical protein